MAPRVALQLDPSLAKAVMWSLVTGKLFSMKLVAFILFCTSHTAEDFDLMVYIPRLPNSQKTCGSLMKMSSYRGHMSVHLCPLASQKARSF